MKGIKRKFIFCSCESEAIVLERFSKEEEIYIALFSRGLNVKRYNFKDRIRHILHIITKGFPYTDEIVLSKDKVKELIKALTDISK